MPVTCEGCGAELEHWNAQKKEWYLVSTGRAHTIDNCPGRDKLLDALEKKRKSKRITDTNIRYVNKDDGLVVCKECRARYAKSLGRCPACHQRFVKKLFS